MNIHFKSYGHKGILVQWPAEIKDSTLFEQQAFIKLVEDKIPEIDFAYHTYQEVYIEYKRSISNLELHKAQLKEVYKQTQIEFNQKSIVWSVPVCYEEDLVPDLKLYLEKKKLSLDALITLHTAAKHRVYFIGFLPGFLYLGGLSPKLSINRKEVPSKLIKKGTVAIGGKQTGIYPQNSPGGWYGIGYTPISFFDPSIKEPTWAKSGDFIQFKSVSRDELKDIESRISVGNFQLESTAYAS